MKSFMKKITSIILCALILIAFNACSSNDINNSSVEDITSQNLDTNEYADLNEDYLSMFRSNYVIFSGENNYLLNYTPYKDSNNNYYFYDVYTNSIYKLSELQFEKSCSEEKLWQLGDNLENGSLWSQGEIFFKFNNEMQNVIVQIYKDNLYVSWNNQNLYKISCSDPSDAKLINTERNFLSYFFYNDEIYFIDMYSDSDGSESNSFSIYKTNLNGENISVVLSGGNGFANASDNEIYNVYISSDYIYFVLREDGYESNIFLYCRCKLDGSEKEVWKINDGNIGLAVNESNIAVISTYKNNDSNLDNTINIEIFNPINLEKIDSFSVVADETSYSYFAEDAINFPMLYYKNHIYALLSNQSYIDGSIFGNKIIINIDNRTLDSQTSNGVWVNSGVNEFFVFKYNELPDGTLVGYYDKQ